MPFPRNAAQRSALQLPPRRAEKSVKMPTISRAEGGQLQAPVSRQIATTAHYATLPGDGAASIDNHQRDQR